MSINDLKNLTDKEKLAFELVQNGETEKVKELIKNDEIRINCLDNSGMNLLDQACFKGNEDFAQFLIENKINVDNRAHEQGYTCLMFAALAGKPKLCQRLLDADARPHATNSIGKSASELAAFVGQHECVTVISSYIGVEEIDKLLHPKGEQSEIIYPKELVLFIHKLTRTHEIHPIRLIFNVMNENLLLVHRKKILYVIDSLFERQLRSKEPNEVLSMKLWLILFVLRELLKFVQLKITNSLENKEKPNSTENETEAASMAMAHFARNLLSVEDKNTFNGVRPVEEQFLRTAVYAFPYKQALLYATLVKALKGIEVNKPPSAFLVICQALFGPRFVETAHFCLTCGSPSAKKRCKSCKFPYCSLNCQKFDWSTHKKLCETYATKREDLLNEERDVQIDEKSIKKTLESNENE